MRFPQYCHPKWFLPCFPSIVLPSDHFHEVSPVLSSQVVTSMIFSQYCLPKWFLPCFPSIVLPSDHFHEVSTVLFTQVIIIMRLSQYYTPNDYSHKVFFSIIISSHEVFPL
jgi:hypothetical protein